MPGAFRSQTLEELQLRLVHERRTMQSQAKFVEKIERRISHLQETSVQPHVKARLCDSVLPERGANKGANRMGYTAFLPQGEF